MVIDRSLDLNTLLNERGSARWLECANVPEKGLNSVTIPFYRSRMNDIRNLSRRPRWRQLCQAAIRQLDPHKMIERIAQARYAVLDQIDDGLGISRAERLALHKALDMLSALQDMAMRDILEQAGNLNGIWHPKICNPRSFASRSRMWTDPHS
jgi:hypothetical protein